MKEVSRSLKLFILCDNERTPARMAGELIKAGLTSVDMAAGSRISYPDEAIVSGGPEAVFRERYPALSLVMIKNPEAAAPAERSGANENTCGGPACDGVSLLRDGAFLRNGTPDDTGGSPMGCPRENGTFGEFGCLGCGRRNRFRFYRVRKAVPGGKSDLY